MATGGERRTEILGIQYLRALAAAMVVVAHLSGQLARRGTGIPELTTFEAGVDVFFVISGFVMVWSTAGGARLSAGRFLARRLVRIVPLYWLATAAMLLMVLLVPQVVRTGRFSAGHALASFLFVPMAHPGIPGVFYPLVIPGWTLNYEMGFYLLFALAIAAGRRQPAVVLGLCGGGLAWLAGIGLAARPAGAPGFYADPIILEFAFGMAVALAVRRFGTPPVALPALAAALALAMLLVPPPTGPEWRALRYGVPAAVLVWAGAAAPLPRVRAFHLLGESSYSLYLSHVFVASALAQAAGRAGLIGGGAAGAVFLVGGLVLCMGAGLACWALVERPVTRALRGLAGGAVRRPSVADARADELAPGGAPPPPA